MRWDHDGMLVVRAEICDRLDRLERVADRRPMSEIAPGLETIALIAGAYGLQPVRALADAFARAARAHPRSCPAALYFERLRDAVGCRLTDERTEQALLASVTLRTAG